MKYVWIALAVAAVSVVGFVVVTSLIAGSQMM